MWQLVLPFRLLQLLLILFLLHTLADKEEVGEEVLADQGVVALVALAGQGALEGQAEVVTQVALEGQAEVATQVALEGQAEVATQVALVDTVAMAEGGLDIQGMTPQGGPPMTPCPSLHKCLVC